MEDLNKFLWWMGQHPYLATLFWLWVACTIFGKWQPKRETVERYPRLLPAFLIARDIGLAFSRMGRPIVAFFAPSALRSLVRDFYGDDKPTSAPVAQSDQGGAP